MPFESRLHDGLTSLPYRYLPYSSTTMMLIAGSILLVPCFLRTQISGLPKEAELHRKLESSQDNEVYRFTPTLPEETALHECRHTSASQYLVTDDQGTLIYLFSEHIFGNCAVWKHGTDVFT
jgi:hypothetical protein